jgi:tetratricopeptide (TPR) repeat protein
VIRHGRLIVAGLLLAVCPLPCLGAAADQTGAPTPTPFAQQMAPLPTTVAEWATGAQEFDGLGEFHREISTHSAEAQRYFDQGMRLLWAFNHDESTRSFARAAAIDPDCASCFWGVALTVGPNYNQPMMAEPRAKVAWAALQSAERLAPLATPIERALIAALATRYRGPTALDPSSESMAAYAVAMRGVAQRFPADLDVQTLFAESMMNVNAWKLWSADGKPADGTEEIVATLESVLQRDPRHPGANHYYIHAVEASPHPEKAVAAAERLGNMMPAAGHLVHMPAHILQRVGRYEDAAQANRSAALADGEYLRRTRPPDYYPMYVGHNYSFLAYSTAMEGRRAETLAAMQGYRDSVPDSVMLMMPGIDWYAGERYLALVRFGMWDAMMAEPAPNPELPLLTAGYVFGRTMAFAATGHAADAKAGLVRLERLSAETPAGTAAGLNSAREVLAVAVAIARARIAASEGRNADAQALLRTAVALEDALAYDEPSDWFFPARHLLGVQLLRDRNAADAERVYREDLRRNPENGWSLYGLSQALKAQGKGAAAKAATARFQRAWRHADVELTASAW